MKLNCQFNGKSPFVKGFFLLLPYLFSVVAVLCASVFVFENIVAESVYYQLITGFAGSHSGGSSVVTPDEGHLPVIEYGSQWATLNVDGWQERDIKVFFGDDDTLIRKGAGMRPASRFCGQGSRTVLSAHVTRHFYEIEDTKIGTLVTMDTVYGKYVYKVVDTLIFNYQDRSALVPKEGEGDMLFMYTCYPRKNGFQFRSERLALICRKVEGKEWPTYG